MKGALPLLSRLRRGLAAQQVGCNLAVYGQAIAAAARSGAAIVLFPEAYAIEPISSPSFEPFVSPAGANACGVEVCLYISGGYPVGVQMKERKIKGATSIFVRRLRLF